MVNIFVKQGKEFARNHTFAVLCHLTRRACQAGHKAVELVFWTLLMQTDPTEVAVTKPINLSFSTTVGHHNVLALSFWLMLLLLLFLFLLLSYLIFVNFGTPLPYLGQKKQKFATYSQNWSNRDKKTQNIAFSKLKRTTA